MKKASLSSILIAVVLLVLGVTAEAQQPAKIPRIGYLGGPPPLLERREAFRQGLRELGYIEGKKLSLSGDLERANPNVSLRSQQS